ncbi:MAG: hypothetical protein RIG63_06835 [Coleofasciculus chthonoplastes F3-SA18-01]|jgi:hypothetical protein|uniref:hypothetical protein n=1 Tax=Coleofasciculus chthonoplastes TaxID=64178 RepID=UPI0032F34711
MDYTYFEFTLPKGFVDTNCGIHHHGIMRRVTGKDEIVVHKDSHVQQEPYYRIFVILSRVITRIGNLSPVTPKLLEQLFLVDLIYLQNFFNHINQHQGGMARSGEY